MIAFLFAYLPVWLVYLSGGILLFLLLVSSGVAIGKSGRHPIWALGLLVPFVQMLMFWLWAYAKWPARDA